MYARTCGRNTLHSRSDGAMTLVEVMIAVLILGIVAVGSVAFFLHARVAIEQAANRRTATQIARERLERARNAGYSVVANAKSEVVVDGTTYSWALNVTDALGEPGDSGSAYKILDVTVEWIGSRNEPVLVHTGMSR